MKKNNIKLYKLLKEELKEQDENNSNNEYDNVEHYMNYILDELKDNFFINNLIPVNPNQIIISKFKTEFDVFASTKTYKNDYFFINYLNNYFKFIIMIKENIRSGHIKINLELSQKGEHDTFIEMSTPFFQTKEFNVQLNNIKKDLKQYLDKRTSIRNYTNNEIYNDFIAIIKEIQNNDIKSLSTIKNNYLELFNNVIQGQKEYQNYSPADALYMIDLINYELGYIK